MNCRLCADIIISILLSLLVVIINTNISFIVLTLEKKMAEHNFMMPTLSSLLFYFFVLEGDL